MGFYVDRAGMLHGSYDYKAIAASQTTVAFGSTTAGMTYLDNVTVIPATTANGAVTIYDGSTAILTIPAQPTAMTSILPFQVPVGLICTSTLGWNFTTGSAVSILVTGRINVAPNQV